MERQGNLVAKKKGAPERIQRSRVNPAIVFCRYALAHSRHLHKKRGREADASTTTQAKAVVHARRSIPRRSEERPRRPPPPPGRIEPSWPRRMGGVGRPGLLPKGGGEGASSPFSEAFPKLRDLATNRPLLHRHFLLPMASGKFRALDLFSGIGGIHLGTSKVLNAQVDAWCDIAPESRAVLEARMAEGALPRAPVLEDVRGVKGSHWRGTPNFVVCAGWPCTNISALGDRTGLDGQASGLFREVARIAEESRAEWLVLENVPPVRVRGLYEVLHTLSRLGYDARWSVLAADEDGAPHQRKRFYMVARKRTKRTHEPRECPKRNTPCWWRKDGRTDPPPSRRFVKGAPSIHNPHQARCKLLGNSVVPPTVASAVSWLLTRDVRHPSRPLSPGEAHAAWMHSVPAFDVATSCPTGLEPDEMPIHGCMTATGIVANSGPPSRYRIERPPIRMKARKMIAGRASADRCKSGLVEPGAIVERQAWSTPRYGTWAVAITLTNRAERDLATQLAFDVSTPNQTWSKAINKQVVVNPEFVENMMGFEDGWTSSEQRMGFVPSRSARAAAAKGPMKAPSSMYRSPAVVAEDDVDVATSLIVHYAPRSAPPRGMRRPGPKAPTAFDRARRTAELREKRLREAEEEVMELEAKRRSTEQQNADRQARRAARAARLGSS